MRLIPQAEAQTLWAEFDARNTIWAKGKVKPQG
jgi:hypothetical protein